MSNTIWVIPIEPLDTRYTGMWYSHIPQCLKNMATDRQTDVNIVVINGDQVPLVPTPGAFLDFGATNIYKSSQLSVIAAEFQQGHIKPGDKFLYTDAWNPTVIQLRYMAELLNIPIEIHGMWHAGSYDNFDFLGRLIGNKSWIKHAERSMFECYDTNWFATQFHIDLFLAGMCSDQTQPKNDYISSKKIALTGWPMDYLFNELTPYTTLQKKQQICFPHRIAPEKQLEIFNDLAVSMPEFNWVVCQDQPLSKHDYHTILGESKMVFSASLQETFGIACIEGLICGAIPLVPDRLSYHEMYNEMFLYQSEWTSDLESYRRNKDLLVTYIRQLMTTYQDVPSNGIRAELAA